MAALVSMPVLAAFQQGDAAAGIAAGLDLAAVGIPDPHADVGRLRGLEQDHLVAADAGAAVGDRPARARVHLDRRLAGVENDEVVAEAVHLAEAEGHAWGDLGAGPAQVHLAIRAFLSQRPDDRAQARESRHEEPPV